METAPGFEWDDFEQRISEALATGSQGTRPPDWVWERIVHAANNLDRTDGQVMHGEDGILGSPELIELVT
jgi:hypothetical protein